MRSTRAFRTPYRSSRIAHLSLLRSRLHPRRHTHTRGGTGPTREVSVSALLGFSRRAGRMEREGVRRDGNGLRHHWHA